jgi:RNA polymerase sigma-70 factor (ECF subfamily)
MAASLATVPAFRASDFDALFEAELAYVWNALRRLGVREADLDDQVNEVFLRVHGQFESYDTTRPVRPWLFAFAVRVAAEHRRLARNQREIPGLPLDAPDTAKGAEAHVEESEARSLVLAALDTLAADQRAVFVALDIEGHSGVEVAEALGISVNTVYSRQRLAREKFTASVRRLQKIGAAP